MHSSADSKTAVSVPEVLNSQPLCSLPVSLNVSPFRQLRLLVRDQGLPHGNSCSLGAKRKGIKVHLSKEAAGYSAWTTLVAFAVCCTSGCDDVKILCARTPSNPLYSSESQHVFLSLWPWTRRTSSSAYTSSAVLLLLWNIVPTSFILGGTIWRYDNFTRTRELGAPLRRKSEIDHLHGLWCKVVATRCRIKQNLLAFLNEEIPHL